MTSREARTARREAERKAAKLARKAEKTAPASAPVGFVPQVTTEPPKRAEINRQNAQHSTGPKTSEGKLASSRNSLKHGLASGEIIIAGEDPAAFEALLRDLLEEHQPANATEELLINEMARSYWLTQRAIRLQNECFTSEGIDEKRLSLLLRYQTTHERAFHKALSTFLSLRREEARLARFVSQPATTHSQFVRQNRPTKLENGFVPHDRFEPASQERLESVKAAA